MPKITSKKRSKPKKERSNIFLSISKYFFIALWKTVKYTFLFIYLILKSTFLKIKGIFKKKDKKDLGTTREAEYISSSDKSISEIRVVSQIKGEYSSFWNKLKNSDSLIGIIIGSRGSGKTAVALSIAENLKGHKEKIFAMGLYRLPRRIKAVDKIGEIENDSLVIIDEGGILFSSRDSMSNSNKLLSELLFISRHKNLTIIFISQNSSSLEINTLRQADFLILKRSSLLQKNFERKIIAKIYEDYSKKFEEYSDIKGISLVYSDDFVGFIENELPSFWSSKVSKSFR